MKLIYLFRVSFSEYCSYCKVAPPRSNALYKCSFYSSRATFLT